MLKNTTSAYIMGLVRGPQNLPGLSYCFAAYRPGCVAVKAKDQRELHIRVMDLRRSAVGRKTRS